MAKIALGSLFDGSGGFPLAGVINGIEPIWASEIEPYPLRVTAARFPNMKQHGDVTKINGAEVETVDIITFGSPCQDLSISGLRKGIVEGSRSSLFFEAIRIIKEMREHDKSTGRSGVDVRPRFAVWENVLGAFSSNRGDDFRCVLEALLHVTDEGLSVPLPQKGKWLDGGAVVADGTSVAWRVYDAQVWVPQRRKRIYLVADFAGECAGQILFEQKGMSGDSEPSIKAWKDFTEDASRRLGRGCERSVVYPIENHPADSRISVCNKSDPIQTLTSRMGTGGGNVPLVIYPIDHHPQDSRERLLSPNSPIQTLPANMQYSPCNVPILLEEKEKQKYRIRRITPDECCRLQGFPDWWEDGVEGSDSARYKMWGNGIALPCAVDVLYRIKDYLEKENATNEKVDSKNNEEESECTLN